MHEQRNQAGDDNREEALESYHIHEAKKNRRLEIEL